MASPAAPRRTDVNLPLQALSLSRAFPRGAIRLSAQRLVWECAVRPAPTCSEYIVRLEAGPAKMPSIYVQDPELVPNGDGLLPHVYEDGSLCVSKFGDFHPGMLFVDSIVPWTSEWLIFYELWRATGLWFGDGADQLDEDAQSQVLHPYRARRSLPDQTSGLR